MNRLETTIYLIYKRQLTTAQANYASSSSISSGTLPALVNSVVNCHAEWANHTRAQKSSDDGVEFLFVKRLCEYWRTVFMRVSEWRAVLISAPKLLELQACTFNLVLSQHIHKKLYGCIDGKVLWTNYFQNWFIFVHKSSTISNNI